ncbi:MAG: hypothetical protein ACFE9L_10570 [Candidatus Hodarchaeota archaeon]
MYYQHLSDKLMNKEKKDHRKKLAKESGYTGLSTIIEELLKLWERNPSVLDETGIEIGASVVLDPLKASFSDFDVMDQRLTRI